MAALDIFDGEGAFVARAQIDEEDVPAISCHSWYLNANGYVFRMAGYRKARTSILLHRMLLGMRTGDGLHGDHINGDRLDNRRSNLRVVTREQNQQNMRAHRDSVSRFRGVSWSARMNKWRADVCVRGAKHYATFETEVEAAEWATDMRERLMTHNVESRHPVTA